ncbi:MAG TPA: TonB-dependent receptor [Chitinophagales bacterium]|nr:TonB-dependent receptor [Chitinophagales bacterium]HRH53468.1 TonB-dependent receptor [Chitinophagales bacterium]
MKNSLFVLFVTLICQLGSAQTAIFSGVITDANTKEPLIGATVFLNNQTGTATDIDGSFKIVTSEGSYTFTASYVGYEKQSATITLTERTSLVVDIALKPIDGILNTIVVTGSKFEKKLGEETVTIDVIKSDLIQNTNDVKLDQTIQRIPGVSVIDGQANIRGGSGYSYGAGSRVLILMDDLPILTGDAGFPSWDFIPMENIQQVEIIKGAASALYGSSALNGIINVRTAYPTAEPVTKLSLFSGVYNSPADTAQKWWADDFPFFSGANFAHRQKFGKFDLVTGAYVYTQDSYLKEIYQRRARYNINTRYRINNNLAVGLNVNAQVNRSSSFFFWDGIDSGLYVAAPGTTAFNQGFKITVDPFLNWYDEHGNRHKILSRYYGNHNKTVTTEQSNFNDLFYGEYQYQKHLDKYALVVSSGVLASYAMVSAELYGDSTYNTSNEAVYLQLDKKWFDKLNVSGGVRYEFNQIAGLKESRPVFRLGANYQVANYTFIRASWGQGYRFPTIAEKYISTSVTGLSIYPNPDLTSETGWSGELGVKQGVKISNWQGVIDVSGFISEYDNMMEFTFGYYPFPGFMSLNIGDTRIMGGEISFIGEGRIGTVPTTLIAGYTYIDPKFKDFDSIQNALSSADYNVLKYRFRHTVKFDVESTIKKFRIGATCNYNSFMEAVDAAFVDPIIPAINLYIIDGLQQYRDEHADGDWIVDIRLAYNINSSSEVSLLCNNVLNREYSSRPAMMDAPRNFTLKYSLTL